MSVTPIHMLPALCIYFLSPRGISGIALFTSTLLIDIEPFLYYVLLIPIPTIRLLNGEYAPTGIHLITHNLFGVVLIVAPAMTILTIVLTRSSVFRPLWFEPFKSWLYRGHSLKTVYLSALLGGLVHLGWDLTMHSDVNLGFPFFSYPNPFVNQYALDTIYNISLVLLPISYIVRALRNKLRKGSVWITR